MVSVVDITSNISERYLSAGGGINCSYNHLQLSKGAGSYWEFLHPCFVESYSKC